MSFEEMVCGCINKTGNEVDGDGAFLPDFIDMDYIGDGVWKCPECGAENSDRKNDIYKARVQIKPYTYEGHTYVEAIVIEPFNEKLLKHMTDTGGKETSELEKDSLEEFLNDDCYNAITGHDIGIFDMEILFYDYATGGDGGERDVVIEICKEMPVTSLDNNKTEEPKK